MRGLAIARAGLASEQLRVEQASHNLANAGTAGYQRHTLATVSFADLVIQRLDGQEPAVTAVGTLGAGPATAVAGRDEVAPVLPGGSNVDPAREMVDLMASVRVFEAIQRSVLAQDDANRKAASEIGRV